MRALLFIALENSNNNHNNILKTDYSTYKYRKYSLDRCLECAFLYAFRKHAISFDWPRLCMVVVIIILHNNGIFFYKLFSNITHANVMGILPI